MLPQKLEYFDVLDGEQLALVPDEGHDELAVILAPAAGGGHLAGERDVVLELVDGGDGDVGHSAASTASISRSTRSSSFFSMSSTPILRMMSQKKPCTTRRRASRSGMPRLRR